MGKVWMQRKNKSVENLNKRGHLWQVVVDGRIIRAGLHDMHKIKILDPIGPKTLDPSVVQPVASRYTDCWVPIQPIVCKEEYNIT
jgi:hypothetical protein